ncbi:MAG: hypothetical protein V7604_4883 [Hyphomicrobiales bacterium]|jgi:hypothetical protein
MADYSGTPLLKKLGYAAAQRACLIAVPANVADLLAFDQFALRRVLKNAAMLVRETGPFDLIHLFVSKAEGLGAALADARKRLVPNGMVWVSWPKKAAKVATDVTEHVVRREALAAGLVDIKVCAVDATWSGLKLVIPRADRR